PRARPGRAGSTPGGGSQAGHGRARIPRPRPALPGDGHQGEGRHPLRRLSRPRERLVAARSKARKRAVDILYEADQRSATETGQEAVITAETALAERLVTPGAQTAAPEYAAEIVRGVITHTARIDEVLEPVARGWSLARMPAVDRAVLRVGAWEVLYNDDLDDAVAIDEAVTLARRLSTEDSPDFVNGLLGRIADFGSSLVD